MDGAPHPLGAGQTGVQPTVRAGFLPGRTVHLHPLARCNLACKHCYSSSGPQASAMLDPDLLVRLMPHLADEGYETLSLSGGEPLLYPELPRVAEAARAAGMRTIAITNGFRVAPRFQHLIDALDGLAVSFDGLRGVHDRVRGTPRAFEMGVAALRHLQSLGRPAAVAYTVSRESLPDLPAFLEMVAPLGVRGVQLRPLVMTGRATEEYTGPALGPADMIRLWLTASALQMAWDGEMAIHCDAAPAEAVRADRMAWRAALTGTGTVLSDEINPLVITPDGRLRPYTFDFPARHDLGSVETFMVSPVQARRRMAGLRPHLAHAFEDLADETGVIDWFAWVTARAQGRAGPGVQRGIPARV
jgi:MoaA/NifB/PqqE/SkfB family radical SAM enzyme